MLKQLIFAILILLTANQAVGFPGEARQYFNDWLVVCVKQDVVTGDAGICRANTGVRDKVLFPYGDGTIFQLTLERGAQTDYHIEFYHTLDDSYPTDAISFQFDHEPAMTLNAQVGVNLAQLTVEQSRPLIEKIKTARWLTISYMSKQGKPVSVTVSLRGSSASLLHIETFYDIRGYQNAL